MKIELKLSVDAIISLNKLLGNVYDAEISVATDIRLMRSIAFDLSDKIDSRVRSLVKKETLFDEKKRHKITFKFHEAWALEKIIRASIHTVNSDYNVIQLRIVADMLNQKIM